MLAFSATLAACALSLTHHKQLGFMRGLADRWMALGLNLADLGVLGSGTDTTMFKPPGYPAFLAAVLVPVAGPPPSTTTKSRFAAGSDLQGLAVPYDQAYVERAARVVYWSHAVLLSAAAALMFLWLSECYRAPVALAAALMFGVNPYTVILAGMLHYSVLHLFAVVAGLYVLHRAFRHDGLSLGAWIAAGLVWGLVTLIRPQTLLLPPFVWAAVLLRTRLAWKDSLVRAAVFTAGMAVAIAPWTLRNYALSGRLVPVSAQSWMSLWAPTVRPAPIQPNHYRWKTLRDRLMPVLKRVPSERLRSDPESIADNVAVEAELRDVTFRNLRRRPGVYLGNAWRSFVTFNLHINSVIIKVYQRVQVPGRPLGDWYWPGDPQVFHPAHASRSFEVLWAALTALGLGGLVLAARERDLALLAPGAVYLCLVFAHAVTWMDLMYYYVKVPFVLAFAFFLVDRAYRWPAPRAAGRSLSVGAALTYVLTACGVGLAAWVLA